VKDFQEELLRRGLLTNRCTTASSKPLSGRAPKSLELTAEMLRQGYLPQASRRNSAPARAIDDLKRGVERAAESVLGDDTESTAPRAQGAG